MPACAARNGSFSNSSITTSQPHSLPPRNNRPPNHQLFMTTQILQRERYTSRHHLIIMLSLLAAIAASAQPVEPLPEVPPPTDPFARQEKVEHLRADALRDAQRAMDEGRFQQALEDAEK